MRKAQLLCLLALAACIEPVREDRSIDWSRSGESVTFQHGDEGVYVAAADGGKPERIFRPDDDVLATSTPLWAPDGESVVFTTARAMDGDATALPVLFGDADDPAGNLFVRRPVRYTCWRREKAEPVALFEAGLDHVGYVAANLAVRWHPSGRSILHLREVEPGSHALFELDLESGSTRRVFPHDARSLIFDWSPDGRRLACVVGTPGTGGIWIGRPGESDWWRVPESAPDTEMTLEDLRAVRPAWTPDGGRFAFAADGVLRLVDPARRTTRVLARGDEPFRDLRWAPDGTRLGVVRGETLHVLEPGGALGEPVSTAPVRRFAGWNARGDRLAYTSPDSAPLGDGPLWSFLLVPDPRARDAVHEVSADGDRVVFRGMRVTFPRWSPRDDRLSLWFTFSPTHRAPLSRLLGWGLRPGDPAALFTPETGAIEWLTVNAFEQAQVGHYHLSHRRYAEAWRWYERASNADAPRRATLRRPAEQALFESICLDKLGRSEEAARKLAEFREGFLPVDDPAQAGREEAARQAIRPDRLLGRLVRDLHVAEVFLALDAADDAVAHFERDDDPAPVARLGRAVVLGQLRLLRGEREAYAEISTTEVAPLLLGYGPADETLEPFIVEMVAALGLLPLMTREFVADLPENLVRSLAERWEVLRPRARDGRGRHLVDLVLRAAYGRLGDEKARAEADRRVRAGSDTVSILPTGDVAEAVQEMRKIMTSRWW